MLTYRASRKRTGITSLLSALTILTLIFSGLVAAPPAHAADPGIDLVADMTVPSEGYSSDSFEITFKVTNAGAVEATNVQLGINFSTATPNLAGTWLASTGGASTTWDNITTTSNPSSISGSIASIPANSSVTVKITGTHPIDSSSNTVTATATAGDGGMDVNPSNNSSVQTISLNEPVIMPAVSKEMLTHLGRPVVTGDHITYRLTFANHPDSTKSDFFISDSYSTVPIIGSASAIKISCTGNGADCPANYFDENGQAQHFGVWRTPAAPTQTLIDGRTAVIIPPGAELQMLVEVELVVTTTSCTTYGYDSFANYAFIRYGVNSWSYGFVQESDRVSHTVTTPTCPEFDATVTKSADKSSYAPGDTARFKLVFKNNRATPTNRFQIEDMLRFEDKFRANSITVTCNQAESTALCINSYNPHDNPVQDPTEKAMDGTAYIPDPATKTIIGGAYAVIEPGKQLVLDVEMVIAPWTGECFDPRYPVVLRNLVRFWPVDGGLYVSSKAPYSADQTAIPMNVETCPTATVTVDKQQDKVTTEYGEARNYTITYSNIGTTDVPDFNLYDRLAKPDSLEIRELTVSCDPTLSTPGVCKPSYPNRFGGGNLVMGATQTFSAPYPRGDVDAMLYSIRAGIPAGAKLVMKVQVKFFTTECDRTRPYASVRNTGYIGEGANSYLVNSRWLSVVNGEVNLSDISTTTFVTDSSGARVSEPNRDANLGVTVTNSCGPVSNFDVETKVQTDGFTTADDAQVVCVAAGGATCPSSSQMRWDKTTGTIKAHINTLPAGGSLRFSVAGKTGFAPPTQSSYEATSKTIGVLSDINPGTVAENFSSVSFGYSNELTTVNVQHTVTGLPASGSPSDITFTGTLVCETISQPINVQVKIPQGSSTATFTTGKTVWNAAKCQVTVNRGDAPAGYRWVDTDPRPTNEPSSVYAWDQNDPATASATTARLSGPLTYAYTWALEQIIDAQPTPLPLAGGIGELAFMLSGLLALCIAAYMIYRLRRTQN